MSKVLMVANWDWVLFNFRISLAKGLRDAGYEVVMVCPPGKWTRELRDAGFGWVCWALDRRSIHPLRELRSLLKLIAIYRFQSPFITHHFTIKPIIYGNIAARLTKVPYVINTFSGLGYLFSNSFTAMCLRQIALPMLPFILRSSNTITTFQNQRDMNLFIRLGLVASSNTVMIPGSGVDLQRFSPAPRNDSAVPVVLMASRLLWDKGVGEFVNAARLLTQKGINARFWVAGSPDHGNPSCIPEKVLRAWMDEGIVEFLGYCNDMPKFLRQACIAVLPTAYAEGLPKFLLEAAACGLPLISTDVYSCRAIVQHGVNGFLVPLHDSQALASAIEILLKCEDLRCKMGQASRRLVESKYSEQLITKKYLQVYQRLTQ